MSDRTLILIIIGVGFFVAFIGIAIVIIMHSNSKKPKKKKKKKIIEKIEEIKDDAFDIEDLLDMVKDPTIPTNDLMNVLIYFNTNFTINEDNAKKSLIFISRLLTHPNADKSIFQYFHRELKPKNKKYIHELDKIEKTALK